MAACAECGKPVVTAFPTDDGTLLHPKCAQLRASRARDKAKVPKEADKPFPPSSDDEG